MPVVIDRRGIVEVAVLVDTLSTSAANGPLHVDVATAEFVTAPVNAPPASGR